MDFSRSPVIPSVKEKTEAKINGKKLYEFFVNNYKLDQDAFVSIETICVMFSLNHELSMDEKKARYIIKIAKDFLYENNFILHNRRSVGWKIAKMFEALDEKEKEARRLLKMIVSHQKKHFNRELSFEDVMTDKDRSAQHSVVSKFRSSVGQMISDLTEILSKSPFSKDAIRQTKIKEY